MREVYSKMTPDTFRSQLQTVLTAYYEDIKGIVCASGCTKSKVVKRKFEDHDNIPTAAPAPTPAPAAAATPDHDPNNAAAAAADPPASPADGRTSDGDEPTPAPSPAGKGGKGAKTGGKKGGRGQG